MITGWRIFDRIDLCGAAVLAFGLKEVKEIERSKPVKGRFLTCLKEVARDKRFRFFWWEWHFGGDESDDYGVFKPAGNTRRAG